MGLLNFDYHEQFLEDNLLFDQSPVASVCIAEAGNILHANKASLSLLQITELRLQKHAPMVTFIDYPCRRKFNTHLVQLKKGVESYCELDLKLRFGDKVSALLHSKPVFKENKYLFSIMSIIDITQQKTIESSLTETQDELKFLAHHDSLTKLPNRYLFEDRLQNAIDRTKRNGWLGALVFADVDRFKVINDDYGHYVGDEVLIEVSKRLREAVREQDTVCRYSGDEFTLILEDITCQNDASNVIEKIIGIFDEPVYGLNEYPLKISLSIGICLFDKGDNEAESLIRRADYAMYESKKRGRNCYTFFSAEHTIAQNLDIIIENELSFAIENNEFHLNFQPQINMVTNEIEGVEVLTRWIHPKRGMISPNEFIYRMENANLTSQLTEWVLHESCLAAGQWLDKGYIFKQLAVNITPKEFASINLINIVKSALEKSGLHPHKLELEITEGSIMQSPNLAKKLLLEFRQMGVRLSLDDFGTGYSALSCLHDYPFNCIKIDKSFVDNLPNSKKSSALVDAMISIADSLELDIIAEGVESEKQKEDLLIRGCSLMQGYLFSPPVDHMTMSNMLNANTATEKLLD